MNTPKEIAPAAVVLFDLDGTLADSEPLHAEALARTLRAYGIDDAEGVHEEALGRDVEAEYAIIARRFGIAAPFDEWIATKYGFYFELLDTLRPREGVPDLFRTLHRRGARLGVVSNSDRMVLQATLKAIGLEWHGLVTVSRTDVREGKPSPEGYLRAARLLDATEETAVVVEDSPTGTAAGLAAGFRTLFFPQAPLPTPAGAERIDGLAALERRLLALVEAPALSGAR